MMLLCYQSDDDITHVFIDFGTCKAYIKTDNMGFRVQMRESVTSSSDASGVAVGEFGGRDGGLSRKKEKGFACNNVVGGGAAAAAGAGGGGGGYSGTIMMITAVAATVSNLECIPQLHFEPAKQLQRR